MPSTCEHVRELYKEIRESIAGDANEFFEYGLWVPGGKFIPETKSVTLHELEYSGEALPENEPQNTEDKAGADAKVEAAKNELDIKWETVAKSKSIVTAAEAAAISQLLNLVPSQADIEKLKENNKDAVTKSALVDWLKEISHPEDTVTTMTQMFEYFDLSNSGEMTRDQMSRILSCMGEPLTGNEAETLFNNLGFRGKKINYRDFVSKLVRK